MWFGTLPRNRQNCPGGKQQTTPSILDNHYGNWLEGKLGYWESRCDFLRKNNPNWRDEVPKGVAAVLPPRYHPDVHRGMLQAAGDTGDMVNQLKEGFHVSGYNFSTGHYDLLPSPSIEELEDLQSNLQKSMHNQKDEILRLLNRRPGTDGQAEVLEHTRKEQKLGSFFLDLGEP